MPKIMIINVTHAEESRVGIVTNGVLTSFEIESFSREHLKGNIYKGVVHRIHQALEAAFVDIGGDRDAFLPLDEICFRNLSTPPPRENGNGERKRPRINEILKPGQEILVQIVKEQFANKPPTLSTYYSLAGRYLVLLPGSEEAGISRRIEGAERERLRGLLEQLEAPEGFGLIVRTVAGFDPGVRELQRDMTYLMRLWESIQQAASHKRGPASIYREHDLVLRNIRDYFTPDIDEVWIDNDEVFQRARDFFRDVMPEKEQVLRLYEGDRPIFSQFNVEQQIESIYKRRVPLKSGGSIVIDGTEALTAIDVNSGRSVRSSTQEETAHKTNIEAANEIARQLRLRDLGGLVVIDFIDMRNQAHVQEVERTLRNAMHEDKARHELGRISQFGLLEVSRQRLRPAAAATSYVACPHCDGHGLVRTTESAALVALRKMHMRVAQGDVAGVRMSLPQDVGLYLLNQKREDLAQLERRYAVRIQVVLSDQLMPHQSEIEVRPRVDTDETAVPQMRLGGVSAGSVASAAAETDESPVPNAPASAQSAEVPATAAAVSDGEPAGSTPATGAAASYGEGVASKRKRRRGRRRGRGKAAAAAIGEALAALGAQAAMSISGDLLDESDELDAGVPQAGAPAVDESQRDGEPPRASAYDGVGGSSSMPMVDRSVQQVVEDRVEVTPVDELIDFPAAAAAETASDNVPEPSADQPVAERRSSGRRRRSPAANARRTAARAAKSAAPRKAVAPDRTEKAGHKKESAPAVKSKTTATKGPARKTAKSGAVAAKSRSATARKTAPARKTRSQPPDV